jgi:hypothetical protein
MTSKEISAMSMKELAEYLNLPYDLVWRLTCNWIEPEPLTGGASCFANDEFSEWDPLNILITDRPFDKTSKKYYTVKTSALLDFLRSIPLHNYSCSSTALKSKYNLICDTNASTARFDFIFYINDDISYIVPA